jgi:hypothetical protein
MVKPQKQQKLFRLFVANFAERSGALSGAALNAANLDECSALISPLRSGAANMLVSDKQSMNVG